jgi:tRNA pseudouridine38-40 synthase
MQLGIYKSIVAYDGTDFHGFQRQVEGTRTVQNELENALRKLGWLENSLKAAGRTDAGVHARGQVIAYGLEWRADDEDLSNALNANLPKDVVVGRTEQVGEEFHPRFSATGRQYTYSVYSSPSRSPLRDRYQLRVWPEPDSEKLELASKLIIGRHDFAAFGQAPIEGGHTRREVRRAEWSSEQDGLLFVIEADAFLYHMVRRTVAAMMSVGTGRTDLNKIQELLEDPTRRWEGAIAPPVGLVLEKVFYPDEYIE